MIQTIDSMSPKELAGLVGVSESSVKRWVDKGSVRAIRTEGGHRRIRLPEVIRVVRAREVEIRDFASLGFRVEPVALNGDLAALRQALEAALLADQEDRAMRLLLPRLLRNEIVPLVDQVLAPVWQGLGSGRVAAAIAERARLAMPGLVDQVAAALPDLDDAAPQAITLGIGAAETLPLTMAGVVLRAGGIAVEALGVNPEIGLVAGPSPTPLALALVAIAPGAAPESVHALIAPLVDRTDRVLVYGPLDQARLNGSAERIARVDQFATLSEWAERLQGSTAA